MTSIVMPTYTQVDKIIGTMTEDPYDKIVMGVYWSKTSSPTLTRTDDAVGR